MVVKVAVVHREYGFNRLCEVKGKGIVTNVDVNVTCAKCLALMKAKEITIQASREEPSVHWNGSVVTFSWADPTGGISSELEIGNVLQQWNGVTAISGWRAQYDPPPHKHERRRDLGVWPTAFRAVLALCTFAADREEAVREHEEEMDDYRREVAEGLHQTGE